jgi:hypothetical protein
MRRHGFIIIGDCLVNVVVVGYVRIDDRGQRNRVGSLGGQAFRATSGFQDNCLQAWYGALLFAI